MATTTPNKTQGTSVLALQAVASGTVLASAAIDVSGALAGALYVRYGRCAATALTNEFAFRIEASSKSSGDGHWYPLYWWNSTTGKTAASDEAVSGTCNAGQATIGMASTTGFTAGELVYVRNSTEANSEFVRVASVSANVSITAKENLLNAQTGSTVYDLAEAWVIPLDLSGVGRLRLVVDTASNAAGQTVAVQADLTTYTGTTTT